MFSTQAPDWNELSRTAKPKRQISGLKQLDSKTFVVRILLLSRKHVRYCYVGL